MKMNITPDKNSQLMKNRFKTTTKLLISKYKLKKTIIFKN